MGHTLVARLDSQTRQWIYGLMEPFHTNKIPYGRNCDRDAADAVMDYHMTLFHWAKSEDNYFLDKAKALTSASFCADITGVHLYPAEENSWLLFFSVIPTENFNDTTSILHSALGIYVSDNLHITLAVSKDFDYLEKIKKHIQDNINFPFRISAEGYDLYHIWTPTKLVRSF